MTNIQGDQSPAKQLKMLKKFENSPMKTVTEQPIELADHFGISYGVCQISTENLNMHCTPAKFVPHPPCSPDIFKQLLTSKVNCKRYSTALRKITSMVILKHGKKLWDHCVHSQGNYFEGDGSQN
jgi:hypothetical protein